MVTGALVVTMVLLGRWQLDVSNSKHFNLQNFGYALQWWAFSAFVLGMWARVLLDTRRRSGAPSPADSDASQDAEPGAAADPPVAYRRYVMPQSGSTPPIAVDAEHAAYNDYLARLADDSSAGNGTERTAQ